MSELWIKPFEIILFEYKCSTYIHRENVALDKFIPRLFDCDMLMEMYESHESLIYYSRSEL